MVENIGPVRLRNGATASLAVVRGPDAEWAERLEPMLAHKGEPWTWQNHELLHRPAGLDARFHVLHREGRPFAHLMVVQHAGVGLLGHVWTDPADRGAGASSVLMEVALTRFREERGSALVLGTEAGGAAFQYYRRRGFVPVEPGSGYMVLTPEGAATVPESWFEGETSIAPLDWPDWPASTPLCLGDFPGQVRMAAAGLIGRISGEGPLLPVLRRQAAGTVCAVVLRTDAGAVVGMASRLPDPIWPDRDVLDVYCHPRAWSRAAELLAAIPAQASRACVAYSDDRARSAVLAAVGFRHVASLPDWTNGREVEIWNRSV